MLRYTLNLTDLKWPKSKPPVIIWVDDFGFAGSIKEPHKDCGFAKFDIDTGAKRLHELVTNYNFIKITYFIVPNWSNDIRVNFFKKFKWDFAGRIDSDERNFKNWLKSLRLNYNQYEFQLHGYDHRYIQIKILNKKIYTFHEFELKRNYKKCLNDVMLAIKIYKNVFETLPTGCRFPGWKAGKWGYRVMVECGIKWFSNIDTLKNVIIIKLDDKICFELPIGFKLSQLTIQDIDQSLGSGAGLFISTHVEGASPTSIIKNSIFYYKDKLEKIIRYIEKEYEVWWTTGSEFYEYLRRKIRIKKIKADGDLL